MEIGEPQNVQKQLSLSTDLTWSGSDPLDIYTLDTKLGEG